MQSYLEDLEYLRPACTDDRTWRAALSGRLRIPFVLRDKLYLISLSPDSGHGELTEANAEYLRRAFPVGQLTALDIAAFFCELAGLDLISGIRALSTASAYRKYAACGEVGSFDLADLLELYRAQSAEGESGEAAQFAARMVAILEAVTQ